MPLTSVGSVELQSTAGCAGFVISTTATPPVRTEEVRARRNVLASTCITYTMVLPSERGKTVLSTGSPAWPIGTTTAPVPIVAGPGGVPPVPSL